jgi:hypothetical protein
VEVLLMGLLYQFVKRIGEPAFNEFTSRLGSYLGGRGAEQVIGLLRQVRAGNPAAETQLTSALKSDPKLAASLASFVRDQTPIPAPPDGLDQIERPLTDDDRLVLAYFLVFWELASVTALTGRPLVASGALQGSSWVTACLPSYRAPRGERPTFDQVGSLNPYSAPLSFSVESGGLASDHKFSFMVRPTDDPETFAKECTEALAQDTLTINPSEYLLWEPDDSCFIPEGETLSERERRMSRRQVPVGPRDPVEHRWMLLRIIEPFSVDILDNAYEKAPGWRPDDADGVPRAWEAATRLPTDGHGLARLRAGVADLEQSASAWSQAVREFLPEHWYPSKPPQRRSFGRFFRRFFRRFFEGRQESD